MAVWQWRLRTTQWRDTTFSCPIKRLCYRKLTLKNCTLPTVCSWGCRLQSHFSSRLLSESEWRQQRGRADFFLSASISDRPKRPKQPLIIKPLAKKVTKTRCATTFFSLFVADFIILFLKHFFQVSTLFFKNSFENSFVCFDLWAVERNGIYFYVKITQPWSPFMVPNRVNSEKFEFFVNSS